MDTQCQSCNLNGDVCSVNEQYLTKYDNNGSRSGLHSKLQYVVGQNDTVMFQMTVLSTYLACEVTVNGQVCNECFYTTCLDLFSGVSVDCENVEEAGSVYLCNPKHGDTEGLLAVFALQDPLFLQGCPPKIY
jgi:hypothetical protein